MTEARKMGEALIDIWNEVVSRSPDIERATVVSLEGLF